MANNSLLSDIKLAGDEVMLFGDEFPADRYSSPFAFAISDQALFLMRTKHFVKNPYYLERVPFSQVKQVFLKSERSFPMLILSAIVFAVGLILTILMMTPLLAGQSGYVSGVPIAMIACGIVLPFIIRGRKTLTIQLNDEVYKWKPKLVVDKRSRDRISNTQNAIISICEKCGINILRVT